MSKNTYNEQNIERRMFQIRAKEKEATDTSDEMIVEGKAICYDEPTDLWTDHYDDGDITYTEQIDKHAMDNCNTSECWFRYNHCDNVMGVARVRNGSIVLENREDGMYVKAKFVNTQTGRDLYEMIRSGLLDRMSFAFTIKDEDYDEETHTFTIRSIDNLYDVSAVDQPAYDGTSISASRRSKLDGLNERKKAEAERAKSEEERNALEQMRTSLQQLLK